nr:carbamoyl-phosphate synthase small chain [Tanacetum cinerariifolium]
AKSFGASGAQLGEVVFNTPLKGYQEILTDPSYAGQFVLMTCPHIDNTGVNIDYKESIKCFLASLVIRSLSIRLPATLAHIQDHGISSGQPLCIMCLHPMGLQRETYYGCSSHGCWLLIVHMHPLPDIGGPMIQCWLLIVHMHPLPMSGCWRNRHTWIVMGVVAYLCFSTLQKVEGWQRAIIGRLSNLHRSTPILAVIDNGHGMSHVSSVDNIVYLRIYASVLVIDCDMHPLPMSGYWRPYASMLVIDCAYASFTNVWMLVELAHLDCDGSHGVCVLFNFAKSGRMAESDNWSPQQPPQEHTGHGLIQT